MKLRDIGAFPEKDPRQHNFGDKESDHSIGARDTHVTFEVHRLFSALSLDQFLSSFLFSHG